MALEEGYRAIDTSPVYGNEKSIGRALRKELRVGHLQRADLLVTSKLWNADHAPSKVEAADARVEGAKRAREQEFLQLQLKVAKLEGQQGMGMNMAKCLALGMTVGNGNSHPGNFNSPATGPSTSRVQGVMGALDALFQPDGVD